MYLPKLFQKILPVVVLACMLLNVAFPIRPAAAASTLLSDPMDKIEAELFNQLSVEGENQSSTADFFVWMTAKADLSRAGDFKNKVEKGRYVYDALVTTARISQADLLRQLTSEGKSYQSFYIANKVMVRGGNLALAMTLANRADVEKITANHKYQLEEPRVSPLASAPSMLEGNISFINADDVWAAGITGEGVVLAGNDTGLAWNHPAILSHYRGWNGVTVDHNYNWWDATGQYPMEPGDGHGHGTHITGTMVGDDGAGNQIGVAPGAKSIHCKNMDDGGGGSDFMFITCFEWDLAPWDLSGDRSTARPDLAPDAINNSWGYGGGGVGTFRDEIAALQAAGILVEVSAGNEGTGCNTLRSPGDYVEVLTTGSVNNWNSASLPGELSYFSSRGASSLDAGYFPDIMAPGENIRSSLPGDQYAAWSGTSMAGPHVTGLIGLLWSANPGLRGNIADTTFIIKETAVPLTGQAGSSCGGDYDQGPNQDWGDGTIDAYAAYQLAMSYGNPGILQGTVTDVSGAPLEGVRVEASNGVRTFVGATGPDGAYSIYIWEGTYDVRALKWGYQPGAQAGVVIPGGATVPLNFNLALSQSYTVSGKLYDLVTGRPLYGRIQVRVENMVLPSPYDQDFSSPVDGVYSIELFEGFDYTFTANAMVVNKNSPGYLPASIQTGVLTGNLTLDIGLQADVVSCTAPGWGIAALVEEDFEGGSLPAGWTSIDNAGAGVFWGVDNPFARPNATGGSGLFVTADAGDNFYPLVNTSLVTPVMDLTGMQGSALAFRSYHSGDYNSFGNIEASPDGTNWSQIWSLGILPPGGAGGEPIQPEIANASADGRVWVDLSMYDGQPFVQIRFNYQTQWYGHWQLDDIMVGDCRAKTGTFVTGYVSGPRNEGVVGSMVFSELAPQESTLTFATPDDPSIDDGWYILFTSLDNPQTITTSGPAGYGPASASVEIFPDQNALQNFTLSAPDMQVDSSGIQVTLLKGTTTSAAFGLQNVGTLAGEYQMYELSASLIPPSVPTHGVDAPVSTIPVQRVASDNTSPALREPPGTTGAAQPSGGGGPSPWRAISPFPTGVADNASVQLDGKIYSLTGVAGYDFSFGYYWAGSYVYDPALDTWSAIAGPTEVRRNAAAGAIGGKIYLAGGSDISGNSPISSLEIYDPMTDTWSYGAPIPDAYAAPGVAVYDQKMYVVGGVRYGDQVTNQVFRYDPADNTWSQMAPIPQPLSHTSCSVMVGQIVCAGGHERMYSFNTTYAYDPRNDSWLRWPDMPYATWGASATSYAGRMYVTGGIVDKGYISNETVIYDFASGQWISGPYSTMPTYNAGSACGFYKIGGFSYDSWNPLSYSERLPGMENCPGEDIPWVVTTPTSGSLSPQESTSVQLDFDAGVPEVEQPGEYKMEVWIMNSGPYGALKVPVTMNVTAPDTWGQITGVLNGLSQCDQPGWPIVNGFVSIWSGDMLLKTIATGMDGSYAWWVEEGTYTLELSAPGYVANRFDVVVTAGQATGSVFDLRLDESCSSGSPDNISATVVAGESTVQVFTLTNQGAGGMGYDVLESIDPKMPAAGYFTGAFSEPAAVGPLSVRSQQNIAGMYGSTEAVGSVVGTAWFNGMSGPLGVLRYAHAQCPETPNSFYVTGGVSYDSWSGAFYPSYSTLRFDAEVNRWTWLSSIPFAAESAAAVCYGGKIYVMGGGGTDRFYIYDVRTDVWSEGPLLPRGVWGAAAAAWNGKIYLVGGDNDFEFGGSSSAVDIFDIASGSWSSGAPMPAATAAAGSVQAGPYLYLVGGYGDTARLNLDATQRYHFDSNTWEMGPAFASRRADFALAVTDQALYAMGGDLNGGYAFDPSTTVERLALSDWLGGAWTEYPQELPEMLMGNSAGFCTEAVGDSEIWNTFGYNPWYGYTTSANYFRTLNTEKCVSLIEDVEWLEESPVMGQVLPDSSEAITVRMDAANLAPGKYMASLVVRTDDPKSPQMTVGVTLEVLPKVYAVRLTPESDAQGANPGALASYTVTVTNESNASETFLVELSGGKWEAEAPVRVGPIAAGEMADFTVNVRVPADALGDASDTLGVKVIAESDATVFASSTIVTTANALYGVELSPTESASAANSGAKAYYPLEVTNRSNVTETFDVQVTSAWAASAPAAIGPVLPGATSILLVTVDVPPNAAGNTFDKATVAVTSQHDAGANMSATLTTTASPVYDINIEADDNSRSAAPGTSVAYNLSIHNNGNLPVTLMLKMSGHAWLSSPSATWIGPVEAGGTGLATVTVMVPPDAVANSTDSVLILAQVVGLDTANDSITLTTTTSASYSFQVAPATLSGEGTSAVAVMYTLQLTNTGSLEDSYTASVAGNIWPVEVTGLENPLAAGATQNAVVLVTIPAGTLADVSDSVTVHLTSQNDLNQKKTVTLTTTSRNVYGVAAVLDHYEVVGHVGQQAIFTITLTNMGNVSDDFSISMSGNTWEANITSGSLEDVAPGESRTITIAVNIPQETAENQNDTMELNLSSLYNSNIQFTANLTTTASLFRIYLPFSMQ